jgi:hypothetical protein
MVVQACKRREGKRRGGEEREKERRGGERRGRVKERTEADRRGVETTCTQESLSKVTQVCFPLLQFSYSVQATILLNTSAHIQGRSFLLQFADSHANHLWKHPHIHTQNCELF